MCGIVGVLSQSSLEQNLLASALPLLQRRGPDDQGFWGDRHIQLGHTRLAILDLSPLGHQPMSYQEERFWIVFNGEIYNYLELRDELLVAGYQFKSRSDTEVLLAAYAHWGEDCLKKLRGMFAFSIWDRQQNQLFMARDRFGEKPFYYYQDQDKFYFASELKTLLSLLPHKPELDPIAIDLYFHYQYVPEPRTPFRGIQKLAAAHCMTLRLDEWKIQPRRYWSLAQIQPIEGDIPTLIRAELERSIDLTLRSDVPVGIALSGGLDSGAIAALAAPKYKDVLNAFSIGYSGAPDCDEREDAKALAHQLGLPFHDVELHTNDLVNFFPQLMHLMDDPIADVAAYGHFSVMQLAAEKGIKVMLSGVGGDELFWGYNWMIEAHRLTHQKLNGKSNGAIANNLSKLAHIPTYEKFVNTPKLPQLVRNLLREGLEAHFIADAYSNQFVFYNIRNDFRHSYYHRKSLYSKQFLEELSDRNPFHPFVANSEECSDPTTHLCQILLDTWLVSNCLSLGDRTSMASSLEVRLPLLDYQLAETVFGLQKRYSDQPFSHKAWFKQAIQDLLPDTVLNRPKRAFEPPYEAWIKSLLKYYGEAVLSGYLTQFEYINAHHLTKLFQNPKPHYSLIYRILVLEIWLQNIDNTSLYESQN